MRYEHNNDLDVQSWGSSQRQLGTDAIGGLTRGDKVGVFELEKGVSHHAEVRRDESVCRWKVQRKPGAWVNLPSGIGQLTSCRGPPSGLLRKLYRRGGCKQPGCTRLGREYRQGRVEAARCYSPAEPAAPLPRSPLRCGSDHAPFPSPARACASGLVPAALCVARVATLGLLVHVGILLTHLTCVTHPAGLFRYTTHNHRMAASSEPRRRRTGFVSRVR